MNTACKTKQCSSWRFDSVIDFTLDFAHSMIDVTVRVLVCVDICIGLLISYTLFHGFYKITNEVFFIIFILLGTGGY